MAPCRNRRSCRFAPRPAGTPASTSPTATTSRSRSAASRCPDWTPPWGVFAALTSARAGIALAGVLMLATPLLLIGYASGREPELARSPA
jgi:hypothetical protein